MLLPALPFLVLPVLLAPPPTSPAGLAALVDAELAFAHRAQEISHTRAFWETFSEDGVVFQPHPAKAKAFYAQAPEDKGRLRWYASWAKLSRDGDFGLTCGPWQYQAEGAGVRVHGHFMSVWRKGPQRWEVILDAGQTKQMRAEVVRLSATKTSMAPAAWHCWPTIS